MKPFESIGEPIAGKLSEISPRSAQGLLAWKPSHLLKHLKRAVNGSKKRYIGKRAPNEPLAVRVKITRADLRVIERLRRANSTHRPMSRAFGGGGR